MKEHLNKSILNHLPINLQDINEQTTMPRPNLNKFVFLKANDNVNGILVDDSNLDGR
jgi:hypothetical protein